MKIPRGFSIAGISILVAAAPVAIAIGADALGGAFGCEVNEGYAAPCAVAGVDIGGALASAFVLGWLTILLLPLAGIGVVAGLVIALLDAAGRKQRRGLSGSAPASSQVPSRGSARAPA
jgi:hypothetical protein